MLNRKQVCESSRTCENGKTFNGTATFFLMPNYNNKFNPKFFNSKTQITNKTIQNLNTNRVDAATCSYDTKQQRLALRRKPTPYRVPFNHYRKTYNATLDTNGCTPNEKIIKNIDLSSCTIVDGILTPICVKPNYTTNRLVNKFGMRNKNSGGDYRNYLERSGKLYEQNAFGILPENKDLSGVNLYKINTVNGNTKSPDCKLKYKTATSLTTNRNQLAKINTATRKWANPGYNSRTSVSSRNRIQQLKYNTILGGQLNSRGGVNNCVNGQDCSLYVSPQYGSNNGVKSRQYVPISIPRSRCRARRLAGMRQSCTDLTPPDTTAPTYVSSVLLDATNIIVITFSENIAANNNIDKDDFAISVNDLGVGTYFFAPSSAAVVNGKVELTLASAGGWSPPFTSIQAVTVAYTKNTYDEYKNIADAAGNAVVSFGAQRVTNYVGNYNNWSMTSSIVININSPINFSSAQVTGVSPGFLNVVQHSFISKGFIQLHQNFGANFSNIPSAMIINTDIPMHVLVASPSWSSHPSVGALNYYAIQTTFYMSDYNGSNLKSPNYNFNNITVTIAQGSRTTSVPHLSSTNSSGSWMGSTHPFGFPVPTNMSNEELNFLQYIGDSFNGGSVGSQQFDDITTPLFNPGITVTISTN